MTKPRLRERYESEIAQALQEQLGLANPMQVPKLVRIVVNVGVGDAAADAKIIDSVVEDLATVTGQRPRINRARKSIANFKLRKGQAIGASVSVRGDRMWELFDRLISIVIPRVRDFRGMNPGSFDGRGNYTFGFTEQLVFPEIDYDQVNGIRGMDITIVTSAETDDQGHALLQAFGFPFAQLSVAASQE